MISVNVVPGPPFGRDHQRVSTHGTAIRRAAAALGALVTAWLVAALVAAGPASAHATVVATDPADGARLTAAPAAVTITFSEPVGLGSGYLRVTDAQAQAVSTGDPTHPDSDGARLQAQLTKGLADGSYLISWRVVSEDSHVIAGSARFVVGDGPLLDFGGASTGDAKREISILAGVARWAGYAGLALLGGLWLLFVSVPSARAAQRADAIAWTGWAAAVASAIGGILAQGAASSGRGLGSLLDASQIDATLATSYGRLHCWELIALGLLGVLLPQVVRAASEERRQGAPEAAGLLLLAVISTVSASGHAAAASPRLLALAADALHLGAASVWLGGLIVLLAVVLPHQDPLDAQRAIRAFSPVAATAIAVLVVTGTYQAWRETRSLDALGGTSYGRLVIIKVALVVLIVVAAAVTRRKLLGATLRPKAKQPQATTPPSQPEQPQQAERPQQATTPRGTARRALAVEAALGIAALVAAAVLVGQPPARAAYAQELGTRPVSATATLSPSAQATITVDPARHGLVRVTVVVTGQAPTAVTLTATLPSQDLGPQPIALAPESTQGPGATPGAATYTAENVPLAAAGEWTFSLTVRTGEFDAIAADVQLEIR